MKVKFKRYEYILYMITLLVSLATVVCVWKDRDDLKEHYQTKKREIIEVQEEKKLFSSFFSGEGTELYPYEIDDLNAFKCLIELMEQGYDFDNTYFRQTESIDLADDASLLTKSVDSSRSFSGSYDGNGYKLSNLHFTENQSSIFGTLKGTIKNLGIQNVNYEASECAVFANTMEGSPKIVNCYVVSVQQVENVEGNSLFVVDASNGRFLNCASDGDLLFITYTMEESSASFYNCIGKTKLLDKKNANYNLRIDNRIYENFYEGCDTEIFNTKLAELWHHDVVGDYNKICINEQGVLEFSEETIQSINKDYVNNFKKYVRNLILYGMVFVILTIIASIISKIFLWDQKKCIVYTLLSACAIITLGYAALSNGQSLIALLYDGRAEGRLKVFTDFFDCIRPGFNPYAGGDNGISTIYPPLITLLFAIIGKFVPQSELYSSIVARDSQMGSMIFVVCIIITALVLYEVILKYKKGNKVERVFFYFLLLTTYPMIHCIERGNVTIVCAICMIVFLYSYRSNSYWKRQMALIALAVAAGIKIYPAILGILLIRDKRFKDTLNCLSYGITLNILPSIFFKTGLSSIVYMVINATTMISNNSIIGGKIDLPHLINMPGELFGASYDLTGYTKIISLVILAIIFIVILFAKLEDWKVYSIIILSLLLLESFTPYYYLLYMFAPFMMFLDSINKSKSQTIIYSWLFVGIFMTFASVNKYPLSAFAPSQAIWNMTPISGFFTIAFLITLLVEGVYRCGKRIINMKDARN